MKVLDILSDFKMNRTLYMQILFPKEETEMSKVIWYQEFNEFTGEIEDFYDEIEEDEDEEYEEYE